MYVYSPFLTIAAVPTAFAGGVLVVRHLIESRRPPPRRDTRHMLAVGVVLVSLAMAGVAYDVIRWSQIDYEWNRLEFSYRVDLTLDSPGEVTVLLPLPTTRVLFANVVVDPGSSAWSFDESGDEPVLELSLASNASVAASFVTHQRNIDIDLTRTSPLSLGGHNITARVSMVALAGNTTRVHVEAEVSWVRPCESYIFRLDAWITVGEAAYPLIAVPTGVC